MNRIDKKFKELKKKKAFIAYICAGDPDLNTTKELALRLDKAGVDIIVAGQIIFKNENTELTIKKIKSILN